MQPITPLPASSSASAQFYKLCASCLSTTSKRHASSYRRNRSRLNVKPDPAFLPSKTEPHDHIIYNPPPSMPNPYHTPAMFLPKNDKRRQVLPPVSPTKALLSKTPAVTPSGDVRLPPPVRKPYEKRYHLKEADLDEMRRLRTEDPFEWSAKKLAKKFDCSVMFVSMATDGIAKESKELQERVTDIVKSRWGVKRRQAREDRQIRREQWYKDA